MGVRTEKRKKLFNAQKKDIFMENVDITLRDGVALDKGAVLTPKFLEENYEQIKECFDDWSAYPDVFLDIIAPQSTGLSLFFYQRIALRAMMRYKDVYITAPRAFSKTFITILAMVLQCIFIPKHKCFICSPNKIQAAKVAKEKLTEIFDTWPLLKREIIGWQLKDIPGNYGKDYVQLNFRNGSVFDVVGALDSTRGGRRHSGLIDEVRDHDEDEINEVVLPLVNVSRRLPDGTVNEREPNQAIYYMTSAGSKMSFAYDKFLDVFEESIIAPQNAFAFGCDYRVPAMHGLIDANYINKLKMSPSYKPEAFAKEYMGYWVAENADSWFSFKKMTSHRMLKNPHLTRKNVNDDNEFYLFSVDVGRIHDQTVCCIFKVSFNSQGHAGVNLVNVVVLGRTAETKPFSVQAADLKKLYREFRPREIVVDTNGLGVGLADELIKTQYDPILGELGPLGFINDDNYKKIQPQSAPKVLYGIKANGPLNSKIHSNCYSFINGGRVRFLISEKEAKTRLLATKVGQKLSVKKRVERLMPHEMTTSLFEEMANLRLRKSGTSEDVVLERINTRFPKDKYSAFSYGLWRIKEMEEEKQKHLNRRGGGKIRKLVFYTGVG